MFMHSPSPANDSTTGSRVQQIPIPQLCTGPLRQTKLTEMYTVSIPQEQSVPEITPISECITPHEYVRAGSTYVRRIEPTVGAENMQSSLPSKKVTDKRARAQRLQLLALREELSRASTIRLPTGTFNVVRARREARMLLQYCAMADETVSSRRELTAETDRSSGMIESISSTPSPR